MEMLDPDNLRATVLNLKPPYAQSVSGTAGRLLPRSERLTNQLVGLERRTTRAGKDSIDQAHGRQDDLAHAVADAFDVIAARPRLYLHYGGWGGYCRSVGGDDDEIDPAEWASARRNVELGSTASSIAKGSDTPSDWTMRRNGLVP